MRLSEKVSVYALFCGLILAGVCVSESRADWTCRRVVGQTPLQLPFIEGSWQLPPNGWIAGGTIVRLLGGPKHPDDFGYWVNVAGLHWERRGWILNGDLEPSPYSCGYGYRALRARRHR